MLPWGMLAHGMNGGDLEAGCHDQRGSPVVLAELDSGSSCVPPGKLLGPSVLRLINEIIDENIIFKASGLRPLHAFICIMWLIAPRSCLPVSSVVESILPEKKNSSRSRVWDKYEVRFVYTATVGAPL